MYGVGSCKRCNQGFDVPAIAVTDFDPIGNRPHQPCLSGYATHVHAAPDKGADQLLACQSGGANNGDRWFSH
ncbi:hypothetical protein GCM10010990_28670 [Croceicoccus mobilis]|uniref:Uncharacterized protein n=1 Tax=Croceicoccus mobilis TaxID=1703339 RepID=A0A917DXK9_9SPHN|nr:hypothetical protein GCM10010990_28670 [Croceicoccus mobilis]